MADPDPSSSAAADRPSRGLRAFFRRLKKANRNGSSGANGADNPPPAPGEVDMVDQAHAFQALRVADVMTPRADITAVEVSIPFDELVAQFVEAEHSRMPIYRETLDDPIGVVHVKDVFKLLAGKTRRPASDDAVLKRLRRLRRPVLYVPASMRGADLLLRMRTSRTHMALVIDEFGGVDGLVTLEDLVEAVVGEIDDEHDEAQSSGVVERPGGVFEAHARAPLDELQAALGGVDLAPSDLEEEIDTVGGLVTAVAGRVPQRGEVIAHPAGFELEVTDADPRRVKRVRVRRTATETTPA
ncbi:MAG: HlyC/CorC family transporter [Caulobacterales bacterium]|nr:HlyC/CorC family transporter [Caulobacterales bacterium]